MKRILFYLMIPLLIIITDNYASGQHVTILNPTITPTAVSDSLLAHKPASTFIVATTGGDYATIDAALSANATVGALFLVYPGTYTDDRINFTANNQCVRGMGSQPAQVHVTAAADTICDYGAFTGCAIRDLKMTVTAATTDIPVIAGSGSLTLKRCHVGMTNFSDRAGSQPSCIEVTGTLTMVDGTLDYNNGVDDEGAGVIKAAVIPGTGAAVELDHVKIDIDGGIHTDSTATATCVVLAGLSGTADIHNCTINVDDDGATYTVGMVYISAGTASHETYENKIRVINDSSGNYAVGYYAAAPAGASTFRSMFNHIHCTSVSGTAYSFMNIGTTAIVRSQLDDIVAADGFTNSGVLTKVSSGADGEFTISATQQILPLWSAPDTVYSGDDAITVKALSDSALSSGQNRYIFCYGDDDYVDDYAQFIQNISFNIDTPDSLIVWVKISESDSCQVDFMLRQRTAAGTTVYMDTTLVNPTGFTDDTWTRVSMLLPESGHSAIPRNTILDLIMKVKIDKGEAVSVTNVVVK